MAALFPVWHLVGVGQGFLVSGGCSLWVASFGSNRSASPVKRYLRWSHILCPLSLGGLRMFGKTGGRNHCPLPLPQAKVPSKGSQIARAISESADEPQTLLRDRGIADGHSMTCLICLGVLADQSHIIRCVRRGAYSG